MKYPSAIRKRVEGDWNCPKCENLNFSFRNKCNKCQYEKDIFNAFDSFLYSFPPSCNEELLEEEATYKRPFSISQLPSVSPFLRDKFMKTPSSINPVTSRLLNFEKENTQNVTTIVTENGKVTAQKKDVDELFSKVKKPNTQRQGDWLCLKCHNLNFAFRKECNICTNSKTEYIQI